MTITDDAQTARSLLINLAKQSLSVTYYADYTIVSNWLNWTPGRAKDSILNIKECEGISIETLGHCPECYTKIEYKNGLKSYCDGCQEFVLLDELNIRLTIRLAELRNRLITASLSSALKYDSPEIVKKTLNLMIIEREN